MAGTVAPKRLESRTSRKDLAAARRSEFKRNGKKDTGRYPFWIALVPRRVHLGWQRDSDDKHGGRWILRRYVGSKYQLITLGRADDVADADGQHVLDYAQAVAKANATVDMPHTKIERLTVRQAWELYVEDKKVKGEATAAADVEGRGRVHIVPALGDLVVSELTSDQLQRWLRTLADAPAQNRPGKNGKPQYRPAAETEVEKRKRRNSANRILTMLKAILNFARKKGHVSNSDAWGANLERFKKVDQPRVNFLSIDEARRLVEACDADFALLVRAALETGARYSELARLRVRDFSHNQRSLFIEESKSGKSRHIALTDKGLKFFKAVCEGRAGGDIMFKNTSRTARRVEAEERKAEVTKPSRAKQPLRYLRPGDEWRPSEQNRLMKEACKAARIDPAIVFHELRHTYASILIMNDVPLLMVAENLGHRDSSMVTRHYGHLAPSYKREIIRERGPDYGLD